MFHPSPLHTTVVVADVNALPFRPQIFDLITATNLLFLLDRPVFALIEMKRLLRPGGRVALLNPSEILNKQAAIGFAQKRGLEGVARETLVNWARRAEENHHWNEEETRALYAYAGMKCMACILKVGPGFGRFSFGII
jgi:ubiquinone/menaquinone biosynthesis C-methylase UbiE